MSSTVKGKRRRGTLPPRDQERHCAEQNDRGRDKHSKGVQIETKVVSHDVPPLQAEGKSCARTICSTFNGLFDFQRVVGDPRSGSFANRRGNFLS